MLKSVKLNLFLFVAMLGTLGMSAQTASKDVSDQDLNKFADAYQAVQMENQKAQQEMMVIIQDNGLEVARFQEIQQAQTDPNTKLDATEKELASHKAIIDNFQKMQPELESRMEEVINDTGLTMERYQEVAAAIQADRELQQELQAIMVKKTQGGAPAANSKG